MIFKEGKVLSSALACLNSDTSSLHQRANAALIVANMARSEANCVVLIEKGVVPILIALTKMEENKEVVIMITSFLSICTVQAGSGLNF